MSGKWEKRIESNSTNYDKTLSGTRVLCMEENMKTSLRNLPDNFSMYVGENDLSSQNFCMKIDESIQNLACRLKKEMHGVSVSTIILRTDGKKINEKGMVVNLYLTELCKSINSQLKEGWSPAS